MKLLFIGDVVGSPGRSMIREYLPKLKRKYKPTVTIINGENAAGGKGITEKIYKGFLEQGAQAVTLGNHTWDNKDIFEFINDASLLVRPANYPSDTPGNEYIIVKVNNLEVGVINLMGRTFMPVNDCPFKKAEELIEKVRKTTPFIFVDFHAEATSEKQAMGWFLDGKVTAVAGTHTHVQTADNRILPQGTAYISDVGMTGPMDGILGMKRENIIKKFLTSLPARFEVDTGREQLNGILVEAHPETGKALKIKRIQISAEEPFFE
ncbi:TIGR00282 family metallophosphoesterase [Bacillus piscicola]|uniref:TIGR00282 family metallophosphoesterase n=1 Tax=Bacillus piscicola TaxID=1632684 RepID=UPI001F09614B|nr:TIGR00282 family metallophosphoesterase [Bacillus piscicola]